jgi:hypothetical protein
MAFSCCVHLGNRDARHSQYSNETKKNSVPLKEELTQQRANSSRASRDDAMMRARHDARNACVSASAFAENAGNACTAAFSLIHVRRIVRAVKASANSATWLTAPSRTPSLEFLQEKYFSCSPARSLGRARQAPSQLRIIARRFATRASRARVADEARCDEKEMLTCRRDGDARRPRTRSSETELRFQEIVDGLRVRLAA